MRFSDGSDSQPFNQCSGSTPDQHMMEALRAGDIEAITTIVRLYAKKLEGYVRRSISDPDIAADIVQDVFTSFWEHRATIVIRTTIQAYLYGSARYHILHRLRRAQLEERCNVEFLAADSAPGTGTAPLPPDALLERRELKITLAQALNMLSPRVRQVALLRWRDRMSRGEIAGTLGVSVATVRNQLHTATTVLRKILTDFSQDQ